MHVSQFYWCVFKDMDLFFACHQNNENIKKNNKKLQSVDSYNNSLSTCGGVLGRGRT